MLILAAILLVFVITAAAPSAITMRQEPSHSAMTHMVMLMLRIQSNISGATLTCPSSVLLWDFEPLDPSAA